MLYYSFLTYCFIIYCLIRYCLVIYFAFAFSYIYIHVLFISYTVFPLYFSLFIFILVLSYTFMLYAFILYFSYPVILYYSYGFLFHVLYLFIYYFHINLYCTSCSCNCLYFHRITRLRFSYHIISYTFHIHFLCVYFSFSFIFMPANTLEVDSGNNWVYPEVLSLYGTVISVYLYPNVLSLYETMISVYCCDPFGATVIQTGSMSSTQTRPRYLSMYLLQQLYLPYKHAYLSLYQVLSKQSALLHFLYISQIHE